MDQQHRYGQACRKIERPHATMAAERWIAVRTTDRVGLGKYHRVESAVVRFAAEYRRGVSVAIHERAYVQCRHRKILGRRLEDAAGSSKSSFWRELGRKLRQIPVCSGCLDSRRTDTLFRERGLRIKRRASYHDTRLSRARP